MALHEGLLKAQGGSWDRPPSKVAWEESNRETQRAFIHQFEGRALWGF